MKDNEWKKVCAACAEGTPPERCAYYGDPNGCNAPTLGMHPEGDLAEQLQEELEKAERRIAELERAHGNAAALRTALEWVATFVEEGVDDEFSVDGQNLLTAAEKASAALAAAPEPPSDTAKMREAILAIKEINDKRPHDAAGYEINDIIEEALATAKGGKE